MNPVKMLSAAILCTLGVARPAVGGELADVVSDSRLNGGIIVLVNAGDATWADAVSSRCTVHGLYSDAAKVVTRRTRLRKSGRYGRLSVSHFDGATLPYVDNLVNIVVIEGGSVAEAEALRVLAPRGVALFKRDGTWTRVTKPWPDDIDEWNQYLHNADNNAVSADKVGPPERLQWTGGTRWGRSHMSWVTVTSILSAQGRLFTVEDLATVEYHKLPARFHLIARDAFNGCELWRKPLKSWYQTRAYVKFVPTQLQRRIAAIGDRVYCTLGYSEPVTVMDAATGRELATLAGTEKTAEFIIDRGTLFAIVGEPYGSVASREENVTLKAIGEESRASRWQRKIRDYVGGTIAAKNESLFYATTRQIVRCDVATGSVVWAVDVGGLDVQPAKRIKGSRKMTKGPMGGKDNLNPTFVITDDTVYCSTTNSVRALRLSDGSTMWTCANTQNYMKMSDLFIADGLVWTGLNKGHDPRTGEVRRQLKQLMDRPMGHDRCYRNRITETYLINSKTGGSDFMALDGSGEFPSPWVRGTCGLGVLPCNGLLYSSPYSCSCCKGTMLTGFNALCSGSRSSGKVMELSQRKGLIRGPAYGTTPARTDVSPADWPVYRNSNARHGRTEVSVGRSLKTAWTAKLPSSPTATTIAGDLVYVAARDSHTLYALGRDDGNARWTFTAGGRIDGPPTYHEGLLLCGCRDGWVYCLTADSGQLVWKFSDLPERRLISADEQLESAWPVNGSVMVRGGVAYFAAGRNSFVDGGIVVYGLDPATGKLIHRRQMSGPYAKNGFPVVGKRNTRIEGFKGGVFASAGDLLYIRHQAFKPDLTPVPLADLKRPHLIASGGFIDDLPQHRTYWTIDTDLSYGPNTGTPGAGPKGDILVIDGDTYYEIRGYLPGRHSTRLVPQRGYTLYSGRRAVSENARAWQANLRLHTVPGSGRWEERWSVQIPLTGRALALAGDTLIAAGAPLKQSFGDPELDRTYAGKMGGVLWLASAADGAKISEVALLSLPTWDGVSVAHGRCFVALTDGTIMCLE